MFFMANPLGARKQRLLRITAQLLMSVEANLYCRGNRGAAIADVHSREKEVKRQCVGFLNAEDAFDDIPTQPLFNLMKRASLQGTRGVDDKPANGTCAKDIQIAKDCELEACWVHAWVSITPLFRSSSTQGHAIQGQVAQGQVTQGLVTQGQVTQGQVTQGQVAQGQVFL